MFGEADHQVGSIECRSEIGDREQGKYVRDDHPIQIAGMLWILIRLREQALAVRKDGDQDVCQ